MPELDFDKLSMSLGVTGIGVGSRAYLCAGEGMVEINKCTSPARCWNTERIPPMYENVTLVITRQFTHTIVKIIPFSEFKNRRLEITVNQRSLDEDA